MFIRLLMISFILLFVTPVMAQSGHVVVSETQENKDKKRDLLSLQKRLDVIVFNEKLATKRAELLSVLETHVSKVLEEKSERADYRVLLAEILVRQNAFEEAVPLLEQAVLIDPQILKGRAYWLLGIIYEQARGWPFSIRDRDKSQNNFLKAIALDPKGLESNYYYAIYGFDTLEEKARYLKRVLEAPNDKNRLTAYRAIKKDVKERIKKYAK